MPDIIAGPAQLVVTSSEAPAAGPALPVAVVTAPLYTIGGNPIKVVAVTDNRARVGGPAMPVVVASGNAANSPIAGPPIPVYVVSGSLANDPQLSAPSFALQNTTTTNDMGPDGYNWAMSGLKGPLVRDNFGKLIAISEDSGGSHAFTYSNDSGATWADSLSLGFLTRGAIAYNTIDDTVYVNWVAQASTDGILLRRYTISRDGSNNITGFTAAGAAYTQFDAEVTGTMEYQHSAILFVPDIGAHGTIVCAWCCRNTGVGGTGNEIRACMRTLTNSAADLLVANWTHIGVNSATTIGNAPLTASYTALLANATTGVPHVAIARLANNSLFVGYHDGTVTGGIMTGNWAYVRVPQAGSVWTPISAPTTISAIKRAGTDGGYVNKGELLSKIVQDAAGNVYLGIATWKSNALGDTWGYAQITPGDVVTLVDDYSANGAHSYAPTGDIEYDATADRIIDSYITTTDQFAYVHLFNGLVSAHAAQLAFNTGPVDIPYLYSRALTGKLCILLRTTAVPHKGYFGTMDWS